MVNQNARSYVHWKIVVMPELRCIRQVNSSAPPKFNPSNFHRHYQQQHVIKKRKALTEITNTNTEKLMRIPENEQNAMNDFIPSCSSTPVQPKTTIHNNNEQIELVKSLEDQVLKQQGKIGHLKSENIVLRHKMMDYRGTIRAVLRCKPELEHDAFEYICNSDKTDMKLSNYVLMELIMNRLFSVENIFSFLYILL